MKVTTLLSVSLALVLLQTSARAQEAVCLEASAWPQADTLFRGHSRWLGADGAYSIDLGNERILWLFGDSWINADGTNTRNGARLVRNSVAIQTGVDPSRASIDYFWRESDDGGPSAFFGSEGDEWFWPGHGVLLGGRLILFLNRLRSSSAGLGFESDGWNAVLVENPEDAPSDWLLSEIETAPNPLGVMVGFASAFERNGYVYAFGSASPVKSHPIYAVRWPSASVARGELLNPEWWGGGDIGWIPETSTLARWPIFENGQSELTIHFDTRADRFIAIHTIGFGSADIVVRYADDLAGPWSAPARIYRPPEYGTPNAFIYSGKAHPHLAGADLVLTYSTNTMDFQEHFTNPDVYYPRFVRLEFCD